MDKFEQLEKFISQIQSGQKPEIESDDPEVIEVLKTAVKLASKAGDLDKNFAQALEKNLINNSVSNKIMPEQNEKPTLFPRWAFFGVLAAVIILVGGVAVFQNKRSLVNLVNPKAKVVVNQNKNAATKQADKAVLVDDINLDLGSDLDGLDSDLNEFDDFGDELAGLGTDLGQVNF